jgi:molybdate transport system substrate-binding protein
MSEALEKTLLAAKSIGYSTGPSGVYMISLFERLGVSDQVKDKLKQTPGRRSRGCRHEPIIRFT